LKVLLVIHGYPKRYNAGSEVYTQTLAHALQDLGCEVEVFAREQNPFLPDYHITTEFDPIREDIPVHLINHARSNARFQNDAIDKEFKDLIDSIKPDIIHFGHLNHLSMSLPKVAKQAGVSTLFTLHDFMFMCPRGQFLQWGLSKNSPWELCSGQNNAKCAEKCFNRFIEGIDVEQELQNWEKWVENRMALSREASRNIDLFLSPSRRLMKRHIEEFGIPEERIIYLDYGFDHTRLKGRVRTNEQKFVFGYIGRHHPSKGIHHLIDAFAHLNGDPILRIWGRSEGQLSKSLARKTQEFENLSERVEWMPEYDNQNIVKDVFDNCDCIVVPSIWDENSPLVIHEAQQCEVPVITAKHGGMGEYVQNDVNGYTFIHRDIESLEKAMQKAFDNPRKIIELGKKGYLYSTDGKIPSIIDHAKSIISQYKQLIKGV